VSAPDSNHHGIARCPLNTRIDDLAAAGRVRSGEHLPFAGFIHDAVAVPKLCGQDAELWLFWRLRFFSGFGFAVTSFRRLLATERPVNVGAHESPRKSCERVVSHRRAREPRAERPSRRIIEAEIRSAQCEVLLEAAKLVLSGEPIEIARKLREMAERAIRPTGRAK
jgi:hypothetical protein